VLRYLRLGDMVEIGTKADVLQRPQHDYTRMLIGAVPTLHLKERPNNPDAPLVLQVKGLEKTYLDKSWFGKTRTVHAAKDVNLEIRRGQTLGIVGESGSGKSTVARCIVRLVDPSGGSVMLGGGQGPAADIAMMSAAANCAHCASACRSCSKTLTDHSIRAAPWVRP
jgi:peptide/nickel transport system ATP-binding protein